ncbi:MAG: hypothetical protein ACE15C_01660 [Phycisphaerae bacterium]
MTKHVLPGEDGPSDWFGRLNGFEQQETRRQIRFKRKHWPDLPDGAWAKRKNDTYPHILPDIDNALYSGIADKAMEYCRTSNIAVHSEFSNLRSSQACCFNVLFPLHLDLELAGTALEPALPGVREVSRIEFEYTGPDGDGATQWLGEPTGGQRGQNRTSIDAAVWWTNGSQRLLTFIEWKYTERNYGTCGGYSSDGNMEKHLCENLDASGDPASVCYLVHGRNTRRYWEHLKDAHIDLSAFRGLKGCPFIGPFYQLMRQYVLAAYCREHEGADEVYVASVGFAGNESLHELPAAHRCLGPTVEDAWNASLRGVSPMKHINVETIMERIKASQRADRNWLAYLAERYGL